MIPMENFKKKYFLGANSCEGFVSKFGDCYRPDGEWRVFIIKGGPGTGKSSFMKYVAVKAAERGFDPILCPCSSDPQSLDAVILQKQKIVIMDGTAPHTVDPAYPGACEKILNFGEFWNDDAFKADKKAIVEVADRNHALHAAASRYMRAVGFLLADNFKTALACTDQEKTAAYADGLCKKYIPKSKGNGVEWQRFLGGITPLGVVSYAETLTASAEKTVIIKDEFGAASNIIMTRIRNYALQNGYEIVTLKNPFLPSLMTDHIYIPALSLAFVTENTFTHFEAEDSRIHARRFTANSQLHASRERMKFNKKAERELLLAAAGKLAQAKAVHDELEHYYITAMDFEQVTAFAQRFTAQLLDSIQ